jgi:hypothetical protein
VESTAKIKNEGKKKMSKKIEGKLEARREE